MEAEKKHSYDHDDVTAKGAESPEVTTIGGYVPNTEEERKLVRRIDMFLMPMIAIMFVAHHPM